MSTIFFISRNAVKVSNKYTLYKRNYEDLTLGAGSKMAFLYHCLPNYTENTYSYTKTDISYHYFQEKKRESCSCCPSILVQQQQEPSFYLIFFPNFPLLSLYNSNQRFEIHRILTEIATVTTKIQETQIHLGIT